MYICLDVYDMPFKMLNGKLLKKQYFHSAMLYETMCRVNTHLEARKLMKILGKLTVSMEDNKT